MQEGIQYSKHISLLYADNLVISAEHEETMDNRLYQSPDVYLICS